MDRTAERCKIQTGATIDPTNAQAFLTTLAEAGFILIDNQEQLP